MADVTDAVRKDKDELRQALRLQALAWRQIAMIALVDKEKAVGYSRWLFWCTVPFVNAEAVGKFIQDHEKEAEQAGIAAGVFQA